MATAHPKPWPMPGLVEYPQAPAQTCLLPSPPKITLRLASETPSRRCVCGPKPKLPGRWGGGGMAGSSRKGCLYLRASGMTRSADGILDRIRHMQTTFLTCWRGYPFIHLQISHLAENIAHSRYSTNIY